MKLWDTVNWKWRISFISKKYIDRKREAEFVQAEQTLDREDVPLKKLNKETFSSLKDFGGSVLNNPFNMHDGVDLTPISTETKKLIQATKNNEGVAMVMGVLSSH